MDHDSANGLPAGHDVLAHDRDIDVYRCPRGCIHLRVGDLTLRLETHDWRRLVAVCLEAQRRLLVRGAPRPGPLVN